MIKFLNFLKDSLLAGFLCQNPIGALIVLGRLQKIVNYNIKIEKGESAQKPTWFFYPKFNLRGLGVNFQEGLKTYIPIFLMTIIPTLSWQAAWHAGWDNSFHKGYEQSSLWNVIYVINMMIFSLSMLYIPMARIHMAYTEKWSSFFNIKENWRNFIRPFTSRLFFLGIIYLAVGLFYIISRAAIIPMNSAEIPPENVIKNAKIFFWICGMVGYWALIYLDKFKIKIYILSLKNEREKNQSFFERIIQKISWMAGYPGIFICFILWMLFSLQIVISQFLVYLPIRGFLNHPFIHLPWFNYLP